MSIPPEIKRLVFASLVATRLAATTSAVGQAIYQPGFREPYQSPAFSARSFELNRNVWIWAPDKDSDAGTSDVYVRMSEFGDRSGLLSDAFGNTVLSDFDSRSTVESPQTTSADVYLGTRLIDRGSRLLIATDEAPWMGDQQWDQTLNSLMVGPQLGVSNSKVLGNWRISSSLTGLFAYHDGFIHQSLRIGEDSLPAAGDPPNYFPTPQRTIDLSQSARALTYSAEWRVAASYCFSDCTHLRLAWSNTYLRNVWTTPNIHEGGRILPGGSGGSGDLWLDSLQLSLIMTH